MHETDDILLGEDGMKRPATPSDWTRAVKEYAKYQMRLGFITIIPFLVILCMALHLRTTYNELYTSKANLLIDRTAKHWIEEICWDREKTERLHAVSKCAEYREWVSRSYTMNIIRLSMLEHGTHITHVLKYVLGWLITWDPVYTFYMRQLITSFCNQVLVFMPVISILSLVYVALLLRYPINQFKQSIALWNPSKELDVGELPRKTDGYGTPIYSSKSFSSLDEDERRYLVEMIARHGQISQRNIHRPVHSNGGLHQPYNAHDNNNEYVGRFEPMYHGGETRYRRRSGDQAHVQYIQDD